MHGVLYTDKNGRCVSPLATWQDGRANLKTDGKTFSERIFEITNKQVPSGYGLATHYFNMHSGLVPENAAAVCTVHDYAAMKLSGLNAPIMHISDSHSFGLYDFDARTWDYEAAQALGICRDILPVCRESAEVLGTYRNIPVCIAIGDNQASFIGSVSDCNSVLVNIGTGSQVSAICTGKDECRLEVRPLYGGLTLAVGSSLCGGSAYALLKDFFKDVLKMYGLQSSDDALYNCMNIAADEEESSLTVDTRFRGTRQKSLLRGSVSGIGTDNFTAGGLTRGFLEGMADELHQLYLLSGSGAKSLVGSGNAVRRNPALRKVLENKFEMNLSVPKHKEEAAFGAALFAATAVGIYESPLLAAKIISRM